MFSGSELHTDRIQVTVMSGDGQTVKHKPNEFLISFNGPETDRREYETQRSEELNEVHGVAASTVMKSPSCFWLSAEFRRVETDILWINAD